MERLERASSTPPASAHLPRRLGGVSGEACPRRARRAPRPGCDARPRRPRRRPARLRQPWLLGDAEDRVDCGRRRSQSTGSTRRPCCARGDREVRRASSSPRPATSWWSRCAAGDRALLREDQVRAQRSVCPGVRRALWWRPSTSQTPAPVGGEIPRSPERLSGRGRTEFLDSRLSSPHPERAAGLCSSTLAAPDGRRRCCCLLHTYDATPPRPHVRARPPGRAIVPGADVVGGPTARCRATTSPSRFSP